jgi:hypothetical protein
MNLKYLVLCICCCGLFIVRSSAQVSCVTPDKVNTIKINALDYQSLLFDQFDFKSSMKQSMTPQFSMFNHTPAVNHLPGMFCKLEYKIETKSKLAPRFRLGSLQYTEWMEGKGNYYMPY